MVLVKRFAAVAAVLGAVVGALSLAPVQAHSRSAEDLSLAVSRFADRSDAVALDGAVVGLDEDLAVFLTPLDRHVRRVAYALNGEHVRVEHYRPYDLFGTRVDKTAALLPADFEGLVEGENTVTAVVHVRYGSPVVLNATFTRAPALPTVADIVGSEEVLSSFSGALGVADATGLTDFSGLLSDPTAEFTLFAPNDQAFSDLGPLLDLILTDPTLLADVLTYHIAPERATVADLIEATRLTTLQGADIGISGAPGAVQANEARIVIEDIPAANGVVHVIDTILLPPPPPPPGTIRGAILDVDGDPVPGARANLFTIEADRRGAFLGRADADSGSYSYSVEPGCYVVVLIAPDGTSWSRTGARFDHRRRCVDSGEITEYSATLSFDAPSG